MRVNDSDSVALVWIRPDQQATTIRALRTRETELRRSRDEYQDLFDGIGDAVLVHARPLEDESTEAVTPRRRAGILLIKGARRPRS